MGFLHSLAIYLRAGPTRNSGASLNSRFTDIFQKGGFLENPRVPLLERALKGAIAPFSAEAAEDSSSKAAQAAWKDVAEISDEASDNLMVLMLMPRQGCCWPSSEIWMKHWRSPPTSKLLMSNKNLAAICDAVFWQCPRMMTMIKETVP